MNQIPCQNKNCTLYPANKKSLPPVCMERGHPKNQLLKDIYFFNRQHASIALACRRLLAGTVEAQCHRHLMRAIVVFLKVLEEHIVGVVELKG